MAIRESRTIDPVNLQQSVNYINNGLTVVSNNNNVIPRDTSGNIIVQSGSYVIIETNSFNVSNQSMLQVLDTRFNYFKFPARTVIEDIPDISLDLDLQLQEAEQQDITYARYKPPSGFVEIPFVFPSYTALDFNVVADGLAQSNPGAYTISRELKQSGIDLRFRVKITYRVNTDLNDQFAGFTIIKNSPEATEPNREFIKFEDQPALTQYQVRTTRLDVVILNSQFDIGDKFLIGGQSRPIDADHRIYGDQSYWSITDASKNVDEWNREIE